MKKASLVPLLLAALPGRKAVKPLAFLMPQMQKLLLVYLVTQAMTAWIYHQDDRTGTACAEATHIPQSTAAASWGPNVPRFTDDE